MCVAAPAAAMRTPPSFDLPRRDLGELLRELGAEPMPEVVPMPVGFGETEHAAYRLMAEGLEASGMDFPDVFRAACALAVRRGGSAHETKVMLAGLVTWLGDRDRPRSIGLQGRVDLAFHFVYGAWLESIVTGFGERAALEKERRDAFSPGNAYDLDDLAATMVGARWAARESARLDEWGDGRRRLTALPAFAFGRLAPGALPDERRLDAVRDFARTALP
ncbi:MAG: hypothetical protein SF051_09940 [Elusimicrobiota bacterium]|nr:hypothetical protein [Elusimicrobiota bacterium]